MKKAALLLLPALLAAGPAVPCVAASGFCSCVGPSKAADALETADAVFRGRVAAIEQRHRTLDSPGYVMPRRVRLRVLERWKGAPGDTAVVHTGSGSGDCGYGFESGREYLVNAHINGDSGLTTSICSRTMRTAEKGAAAEMAELRRLTAAAR